MTKSVKVLRHKDLRADLWGLRRKGRFDHYQNGQAWDVFSSALSSSERCASSALGFIQCIRWLNSATNRLLFAEAQELIRRTFTDRRPAAGEGAESDSTLLGTISWCADFPPERRNTGPCLYFF
jgi:hypothetical protein